jgi:hypothetical protein
MVFAIKNDLKTMKGMLALNGRDNIAASSTIKFINSQIKTKDDLQKNKMLFISLHIL